MKVITVARKPLSESSVALNVLKHGTGAINVDGCRVDSGPSPYVERRKSAPPGVSVGSTGWTTPARPPSYNEQKAGELLGRWPANLLHDGSPEVMAGFPVTGPARRDVRAPNGSMGYHGGAAGLPGVMSGHTDDGGSAARFFKPVNMKLSDEEMP